jgi:glycosyltransferase involved in cell wall biosynthesis
LLFLEFDDEVAMMANAVRRANDCWRDDAAAPLISVLVPFYEYDAANLVRRLAAMAARLLVSVEMVFADDGSPTRSGAEQVLAAMTCAAAPCLLIVFDKNIGRAAVRNQLAQIARGEYLVFMDCDMIPDEDDFLDVYAQMALAGTADIAYGGRSAKQVGLPGPEFDLHRAFTERRETLSAAVRNTHPAYHFYSCNFLVRREVILAVPIDERFTGWGWEDCEWAARASESFKLIHIDNPATHLGLLEPGKILMKYEESLGNFSLMLRLRREMIVGTSLYKAARWLGRLQLGSPVKALCRKGVLMKSLPFNLRIACLMWFKAALYSRLV